MGIRKDHAQASIQRLLRMGLLERADASGLKRSSTRLQTTDDVKSLAIQRAHTEDFERIAGALRELPVDLRDVSSLTMPADPKLLPQAKVILRQAQAQIEALMETSPGTEVYRVMTCLFPLTQVRQRTSPFSMSRSRD